MSWRVETNVIFSSIDFMHHLQPVISTSWPSCERHSTYCVSNNIVAFCRTSLLPGGGWRASHNVLGTILFGVMVSGQTAVALRECETVEPVYHCSRNGFAQSGCPTVLTAPMHCRWVVCCAMEFFSVGNALSFGSCSCFFAVDRLPSAIFSCEGLWTKSS